jgi:hypothetical protein
MDVENEIGARKIQFVMQIDSELDADHVFPRLTAPETPDKPEALGRAMKRRFATGKCSVRCAGGSRGEGAAGGRHLRGAERRGRHHVVQGCPHLTRQEPPRQEKSSEIQSLADILARD